MPKIVVNNVELYYELHGSGDETVVLMSRLEMTNVGQKEAEAVVRLSPPEAVPKQK